MQITQDILDIFKQIELDKEKSFNLLVFFHTYSRYDRWKVVMSADWFTQDDKETLTEVVDNYLMKSEKLLLKELSAVIPIRADDNLMQCMATYKGFVEELSNRFNADPAEVIVVKGASLLNTNQNTQLNQMSNFTTL